MGTSTSKLCGTVVIEGVVFHWSVARSPSQDLTVSHPTIGTQTQPLGSDAGSQAHRMAREMLGKSTGFLEAVDDASMSDADPEPTIV
jgi:hypothetical protein